MQWTRLPKAEPALAVALLLLSSPASSMLDCQKIRINEQNFDLSKLGGPHSVVTSISEPPSHSNTSYTIDLCKPLRRKGDVPQDEECPNGTRVCAIQRTRNDGEDKEIIHEVIPIAGDLANYGGQAFEYEAVRLKESDAHDDREKEGLRLTLKGGAYPLKSKPQTMQRAIIELLCSNKTGLEGEWKAEDEYETKVRVRDDDKKDDDKQEKSAKEKQYLNDGAALIFNSYEKEGKDEVATLRLTWHTQAACERSLEDGRDDASSHWGFFTWMFFIIFLGVAAYLIFGSWLNYNRYGARGWDLIPHGDTIRDVPYLMKDFTRRVLNTVQGSGSRGGYSAV